MSKKSIGSRTLKAGAALLAVGAGVAAINAKNKNGTEKKEIKEIQKKEYRVFDIFSVIANIPSGIHAAFLHKAESDQMP